jgi:ribosomal protein L37E
MTGHLDPCAAARAMLNTLSPSRRSFVVRTPLVEDECRWFGAAVEHGLVGFRDCAPECPRLKKWGASGPDEWVTPAGVLRHLFSSPHAEEPSLNREYIPHLAAYARVILGRGYDRERSSFSLYRTFSRDLITKRRGQTYETDAEFYDSAGRIHLQVEAKAEPRQVDLIAGQLDLATSLGELPSGTVKEIEYVLDLAPRYLWLVGPGTVEPAAHVFEVEVEGLTAKFNRVNDLPPPPSEQPPPESPSRTDVAGHKVKEDEFACPNCKSDDVRGHRAPKEERLTLLCQQCGYQWFRVPRPACPRCGSGDVEGGGYTGWAYDDPEEARENTMASWESVERVTSRCHNCRHVWGTTP